MSRANFVQAKLAAAATAAATSLSIQSAGAAFALPPVDGGVLTLTDSIGVPSAYEIISYTSRSGSGPTYTLNGVTRGVEGTTARGWSTNHYVLQGLTAGELQGLLDGKQPLDENLTALAGLTGATNKIPYFTAAGAMALALIQGSQADDTLGALMGVGAFGWGVNYDRRPIAHGGNVPPNALFGKGTRAGFANGGYVADGTGLAIPTFGNNTVYGVLITHGQWSDGSASSAIQREFITQGRRFLSVALSATEWGPWHEQFGQGNIIGTVTQSAGVPTGAVIERGSNANGDYVKLADGTALAWTVLATDNVNSVSVGGLYSSNAYGWTLPTAFANVRVLGTAVKSDGGALNGVWAGCYIRWNAATGSGGSWVVMSATNTAVAGQLHLMAIGRWYV